MVCSLDLSGYVQTITNLQACHRALPRSLDEVQPLFRCCHHLLQKQCQVEVPGTVPCMLRQTNLQWNRDWCSLRCFNYPSCTILHEFWWFLIIFMDFNAFSRHHPRLSWYNSPVFFFARGCRKKGRHQRLRLRHLSEVAWGSCGIPVGFPWKNGQFDLIWWWSMGNTRILWKLSG